MRSSIARYLARRPIRGCTHSAQGRGTPVLSVHGASRQRQFCSSSLLASPFTSATVRSKALDKAPTPSCPGLEHEHTPTSKVDGREVKTLLIVYHTLTDGTRQMAQAAYEAALATLDGDGSNESVGVRLVRARDCVPRDLTSSSAYIFATPENLASMAGIMKDFFDRCYYPVLGQLNGRSYAVMICAGSDGEGAMRQLDRIALGWRLKKAAEGLIVITHAQTAERCHAIKVIEDKDLERCREVGAAMAEGLRLGMF